MITLTATITLADGTEININKQNIISINQSIADRSDINLPSYGIISNRGSIKFNDKDFKFLNYIQAGYLKDEVLAEIFLINTLNNVSQKIGEMKAVDWNYDSNNGVVSASLHDDLEEWQNIEITPLKLQNQMTGLQIYNYLVSQTPSKWQIIQLDDTTKAFLNSYIIPYPYLLAGNLWSQWNKLCIACGLHIFQGQNGKIYIRHS